MIPRVFGSNEAWVLHREDLYTTQDGHCNIYLLLDAYSKVCLGHILTVDLPEISDVSNLLNNAKTETGGWPRQVFIAKNDPYVTALKSITKGLNVKTTDVPYKDLKKMIRPFSESFDYEFKGGKHLPPLSTSEREEMEASIPQTYNPCPCASGKKFKYCCQKSFYDITEAMCQAEAGNLGVALHFMKEAELKVGLTAEVLCRYGICWSYFDHKESIEYLEKAIQKNPNHPRTNYILGIEAVENKNYLMAIQYYQNAIKHYPKEDKFHLNETLNNLGSVYYRLMQYQEAKATWEKALVLLPNDEIIKRNLIECIYENPIIPEQIREISPFIKRYLTAL